MTTPVLPAATSQSVYFKALDNTTGLAVTTLTAATAGLVITYKRTPTGAATTITLSDLAAENSAWSSGGMKHVAGGIYRLCIPDGAVPAAEGDRTTIAGTSTAFQILGCELVGKPVEVVSGSLVAASVTGAVGSVTGAVGSVAGAVGSVAANGITAASIAADAIGASELAADAVAEIQSGLATSAAQTTAQTDLTTLLSRITGAVSLATATTAAAIRSALGLASANLDTQIAAIPTSGVVADAVLDELLSGHTTSGSAGAALSLAGSAADPMINDPADYTSGQLGYLIGRLAGGRITVRGTTTPTGDMDEIVGGADYSASDGYSFDWTDADSELAWPALTSAAITWVGRSPDGQETTLAMTVVTPTGDKVIRLAMTAAQTAALVAVRTGIWTFTVWATLTSGRVRPLAKGTVPVVELVGP